MRPGISAVLPCYEEVEILERVVTELTAVLQRVADPWEIVLVSAAGATDGTPALALRLAQDVTGLRCVLQSTTDPGYGRAVARGVAAARLDWILLLDTDGQLDPRDLPALVVRTHDAPLVVGYRSPRADAWPRRLAGAFYSRVVSALMGFSVRDVDCAFKLLHRARLGPAPLRSRTGAVNAELLSRGTQSGGRLVELPVSHRPRAHGRTRFEMRLGIGVHLPHPVEVWSIARDVAALSARHWRARLGAPTR